MKILLKANQNDVIYYGRFFIFSFSNKPPFSILLVQ
jgi:hypothetical protein